MGKPSKPKLSRREREIMDVIYQLGEASVHEVVQRLHDRPAYDTVRVTLGILKKKGHLEHRREGRQYVYSPTVSADTAARSAARDMLKTFFGGSPTRAITTFLDVSNKDISAEDLAELERLIEERRKK